MKKAIFLIFIIIFILIIKSNKNQEYITIPSESIRFRIIANSNTAEDQSIKQELLATLTKKIEQIVSSKNITETRVVIKENLNSIQSQLQETIKKIGSSDNINVEYGKNYFPSKIYKGVKYEEGYYESLVVEIGDAKGDNFWCVLYPPLCMLESTNDEEIEYKFYVKEIVNKYFK